MAYTPVFSQGVKFIKIARIDDQGNDNTLSLQELNTVRIKFSDVGIIDYPITSIAKYDNYFLFGVVPTNRTSSTDNEILNYRFSASYTRDFASGVSYIIDNYGDYGAEAYDDLNYFDINTGEYTLGNQSNIPITFTVSASVTASADSTVNLYINSNIQGVVATKSQFFDVSSAQNKYIMSASYTGTPLINEYFYLSISPGSNIQFTGSFFVTQSTVPQAGISDLVVLEPFIDENFINSNYDVLAGNAVIPRYSELYMDVDYSTNTIQAVNLASIIDGTATRAAVQDSNYTTAAHISPRYIGKELTSAKFNEWTEGDISYGKVPNVSNPEVNFVSFKSLNGTSPQWGNNNVDMTQVNIEYIIDNNNSITKPINDSEGINLNTIRQTFAEALIESSPDDNILRYTPTNATILLNNVEVSGSDLSTLNGSWPLYKSGYRIEPILYTQTASYDANNNVIGFGYTGSITFVQGEQGPNVTKNNYMMYAPGVNDVLTLGMTLPAVLHFSSPTFIGASASFTADNGSFTIDGIYKPTGSLSNLKTEGYILDFHIYLAATTLDDPNDRRAAVIIDWALQKSTNAGATWTTLTRTQTQYISGKYSRMFYRDPDATTSSLYRVAAINIGPYPGQTGNTSVYLTNKSYFWVTQYPNPGVGTCTSFWTTGSSASILLASTASDGLNNYRNQKQKDIENSGFKPINLDFEPQTYDEIRFEGLEQLSFTIVNVTSSANNQMVINLDREIPNGVDLNYFFLRRYVDDPSSILIDVNYPLPDKSGSASITGNGILKPQYVTNEVNTIIQNTINQNLI
jgi:hypothetical protein